MTEIYLPSEHETIPKPEKFEQKVRMLKDTGKMDKNDFGNAKEIGQFIDFYNGTVKESHDKAASNEVLEISKLLVKLQGTTYFTGNQTPSIDSKTKTG